MSAYDFEPCPVPPAPERELADVLPFHLRTCSVADCGRKHYARTYCKKHWMALVYRVPTRKGPGRPRTSGGPCAVCGDPSECVGLCGRHYKKHRARLRAEGCVAPYARCKGCGHTRALHQYEARDAACYTKKNDCECERFV